MRHISSALINIIFGLLLHCWSSEALSSIGIHDQDNDFVQELWNKVQQLEYAVQELTEMVNSNAGVQMNREEPRGIQKRITMYKDLKQRILDSNTKDTILNVKDTEVGFHANLIQSQELTPRSPLIFDNIPTNIGAAYDTSSGKFVAPVSGTYLLSLTVVCEKFNLLHASVIKNGYPIFNSLCDNRKAETWNQGGGVTIAKLKEGDALWVGMIWPDSGIAYGHGMTSFSGYLLHI